MAKQPNSMTPAEEAAEATKQPGTTHTPTPLHGSVGPASHTGHSGPPLGLSVPPLGETSEEKATRLKLEGTAKATADLKKVQVDATKKRQAGLDKLHLTQSTALAALAEATAEHREAEAAHALAAREDAHRLYYVSRGLPVPPMPAFLPTRLEAANAWLADAAERLNSKVLDDPDLVKTNERISLWMRAGNGGERLTSVDELAQFMAVVGL